MDVRVGERVRLHREQLGISRGVLASRLGVSFQQLQKYEKGTNRISAGRLYAIAEILGVSIQQFFAGHKEEAVLSDGGPYQVPEDFVATVEGLQLVRTFRRIRSSDARSTLLKLATLLADSDRPERGSLS